MMTTNKDPNLIQQMFERFKSVHPIFNDCMQKIYEKEGFDPTEMAIYLNIMTGQYIHKTLMEYTGMTTEEIGNLANMQVESFSQSGTMNKDTLTGQIIGLQAALGVALTKLDLVMKSLAEGNKDPS